MQSGSDALDPIFAAVRDYVEGLVGNDPEKLRRAMHPRACEIGNYQGALLWQDREAMIAMIDAETVEPVTAPAWHIHSVGVDGDVAVVRVEDDWLGTNFLDVLTLLRIDGRWQIVAKVFQVRAAQ